MRHLLLALILACSVVYADDNITLVEPFDLNTTSVEEAEPEVEPLDEPVVIEDTSGLSEDELRQKAAQSDKEKKKVTFSEVVDAIDEDGSVNLEQIQKVWENLSPTPKTCDWVQTKGGEWFKGEIIALYNDELEFDSDELDEYTFDFDDIAQIKSYNVISVNIENVAQVKGIIRLKENTITIIQGDHDYKFSRDQIVSFAPSVDMEMQYWSGKVSLSIDQRSGNKNQMDFSTQANIQRRTAKSRLNFDYLGRFSQVESTNTANDHRLEQKFDYYVTRDFFVTPLFSEYFQDTFQNIKHQFTVGLGVGYTPYETKTIEWNLSGGPAYLFTKFDNVVDGEESKSSSAAIELSTDVDVELTEDNDLVYIYKVTFTDERSGSYKHHMVLTLENEITSWLDLDISYIWDYIHTPEKKSDGSVPENNDFQLLVGLGVDF